MRRGGCWIFLSHSSHDIEKVRIVRNEFERLGHNPLAFHLKCLSVDTEEGRHELDSLIKREIDAREWFVFCESPEADQSPYVQDEHAYIISSGKDNVWKIDMRADIDSILYKVRKICADITVFISYVPCDRDIIKPLINALIDTDYSVWIISEDIYPNSAISKVVDGIDRCVDNGFYIVVITQESIKSPFVMTELDLALRQGSYIVPIVIGNPELPKDIQQWIGSYIQISEKPTEEDFARVVDILDAVLKRRQGVHL